MTPQLAAEVKAFLTKNTVELTRKKVRAGYALSDFKISPFVSILLSSGMQGKLTSQNMARTLLYPRVYGTSVNTTLGGSMQKLCTELLGARPSAVDGMDIEFLDKVSGEETLLQLKAGPNTINADDVAPILAKMLKAYRLLQQNHATTIPTLALGITYGRMEEVSGHYRNIHRAGVGGQDCVPILIGERFWHSLTGDPAFYRELISLFIELFEKEDLSESFEEAVTKLAQEIETTYFVNGKFDPNRFGESPVKKV